MNEKKILVVEDDLNLGFLLLDFLQTQDYRIKLCKNGLSALQQLKKEYFDLCLIDVMMPKMDGYALARNMRSQGVETPFIFLTAKSLKEDKLTGYSVGAEDYITKPFDEEELLCKIQVILRRHKKDPYEGAPNSFQLGTYEFKYDRHELIHNGTISRLTEKENEVLRLLALNRNSILKREDAVTAIYGKADYFLGRSFDVYISRLRKLLLKDPSVEIQNVYKVGFILNVKEGMSVSAERS